MNSRKSILALVITIIASVLYISIPANGQLEVEDLAHQAYPLNPGQADLIGDPPELGDGTVVMEFLVKETDFPFDDPSDVEITDIYVNNWGTALLGPDIEAIAVWEYNINTPEALNLVAVREGIPFASAWPLNMNLQEPYVIPDGQEHVFQVIVRTADTDTLQNLAENHTVRLQVTLDYEETIGSPPEKAEFTATVTDRAEEIIRNAGFEDPIDLTTATYLIRPGGEGVVQEIKVCDYDSNKYNPVIDEVWVVNLGSAIAHVNKDSKIPDGDIAKIRLWTKSKYQLGQGHEASAAPNEGQWAESQGADFNRGGPGVRITPKGFRLYVKDGPDPQGNPSCEMLLIEVELTPYAYKGHTIQLRTRLSTAEPIIVDYGGICNGCEPEWLVDPQVVATVPTVIGEGAVQIHRSENKNLIYIYDRKIASGAEGAIPVDWYSMDTIPTIALGSLQATLSWNPKAIDPIDDPANPDDDCDAFANIADGYQMACTRGLIDHQVGTATFTIHFNPGSEADPVRGGKLFELKVKGVGSPDNMTHLNLEVREATYDNGKPIPDITEILISPGQIKLVVLGDVDGNDYVTIHDALLVAQHIVELITLTEEQLLIADVDGDGELTSEDAAQIARMAIGASSSTSSASETGLQSVTALSIAPEELAVNSISAFPNPMVSNYAAEFKVEGQGVAEIQVQVFNLVGVTIFDQTAAGNSLKFYAVNGEGQALANGVYLYTITVKGYNGQVIRSKVRKLVILR